MIELLLVSHGAVLILLFRQLDRLVGRIIALLYVVYMASFTVLKPVLLYYLDLYFPYSTNDESAVLLLLVGSLLFLLTQSGMLQLLARYRPGKMLVNWFDFSRATPRGLWLAFAIFMVISFIGSSIKFGEIGYLFSSASTFDATMAQAGGTYFINYLAESLFYAMLAVIGYYYKRLSLPKSFVMMVTVVVVTYIWAKMAARTGVLVVLICWLACSLSVARQRAFNIIYLALFGYVLLILLYMGNLVRLGEAQDITLTNALFGSVISASSDLAPVDNATLLYSEMDRHESTAFIRLIGAATPLVLIPSSIFPFKIPADKDTELTRIFFPDGADATFFHEGSTLTFTIPGSGYADGGFAGVLASSIMYALIFCVYIWIYRHGSASARMVAAFYMVVHVVGYRLSVEALLMTFYSTLMFIGIVRMLSMLLSRPNIRVAPRRKLAASN